MNEYLSLHIMVQNRGAINLQILLPNWKSALAQLLFWWKQEQNAMINRHVKLNCILSLKYPKAKDKGADSRKVF